MRARQLKPGFFKNEDLAECSPWARLVFAGLWTMADRAGRLEDRPKRIKAELLPFDAEPIVPILDELERWGFLRRYRAQGRDLMWIPRFGAHQNPHKNEKESELPPHPDDPWAKAPEGGFDEPCGPGQPGDPDRHGASTVQARCENGTRRASSPIPSSPIPGRLHPSFPPLDSEPPASAPDHIRGRESGSGGGEEFPGQAPYEAQAYAVSLEIQQIGEGYPPDRYDLGAADTALKELAKRRQWPGVPRVLDDLTSRLSCEQWTRDNGRFAPMLSRYIRERMWLMKVPEARAAPAGFASAESKAIDDIAEKLRRKEQKNEHPEFSESHPGERAGSAAAPGPALPEIQAGGRAGPAGR